MVPDLLRARPKGGTGAPALLVRLFQISARAFSVLQYRMLSMSAGSGTNWEGKAK